MTVTAASTPARPGETAQFTATASFSNGTTQGVTTQASWQSTNTAIAAVSATGMVTAVAAGDAEIRATYQSVAGNARITVAAPTPQCYALSGVVREDGTNAGMSDARLEVTDGPNAGKTTTTPNGGAYALSCLGGGTFRIRVTRSGYETQSSTVSLVADSRMDFHLRKSTSGPAPSPGPGPSPTPGGSCAASSIPAGARCIGNGTPPVTAVCSDGAFSCSANRQGTCSSHGGVKCWVCPGALCNGFTEAALGTSLDYTPVPVSNRQ